MELSTWNDSSVVTMPSNCYNVNPVRSALCWSVPKRSAIDLPAIVYQYSQFKGKVAEMDKNIAKLHVAISMKKWRWSMFRWQLNVTINNAWQSYGIFASSQKLKSCWICPTSPGRL